jgi:O-antigen ligase
MLLGALAGGRSWSGRAARLALVLLLVTLTAFWTGGEVLSGTVERLAEEIGRPDESIRGRLWADALMLWQNAPVLGTGLGTFDVAYPRFRTIEAPFTFSHAESDWVQLLTDTGLLGVGLALAALSSVALALARQVRQAPTRAGRLFALAGLVILGGTAVQGIGNYNLPVTSNFIYLALAVVLGARAHDAPERPASARSAAQ